jgi:Coenzyme PQQ synthesis protein D (PqqD)
MSEQIDIRTARNRLYPRLRFYGHEFVFDTVSGSFYRLTPVAGRLLKSLGDGADYHRLIETLETDYKVDRAIILRDVELFLNSILAEGWLDQYLPGRHQEYAAAEQSRGGNRAAQG